MQSAVRWRASSGTAPALEDPSESLTAEGPAEDELEMGAMFTNFSGLHA